jgi:hypothetical protein
MIGRHGGGGPDLAPNGRGMNYGFQPPMEAVSRHGPEPALLPPDASPTLYIEGLPSDCTRREVARILFVMMQCFGILSFSLSSMCLELYLFYLCYIYSLTSSLDIFRPFVGYREVRLVSKEAKHVSL